MNMKTLSILLILAASLNAFAQEDCGVNPDFVRDEEGNCVDSKANDPVISNPPPAGQQRADAPTTGTDQPTPAQLNATFNKLVANETASPAQRCTAIMNTASTMQGAQPAQTLTGPQKDALDECKVLQAASRGEKLSMGTKDDDVRSADGKIVCKKKASYTFDYDPCERAVKYYSAVVVAETAMNVEQQVRTDISSQKSAKKTQEEMAKGGSQTAVFDSAAAANKQQKGIQEERMIAYGAAVAALIRAHGMLPSFEKAQKEICSSAQGIKPDTCASAVKKYKGQIIANNDAKTALMAGIMEFTAKGLAAGIKMNQYGAKANQIEAAKNSLIDDPTDLMMEACQANPTDPACAKTGVRVAHQTMSAGDFGAGDAGGSNTFDLNPGSEAAPELGAATNLDENAPIAGVNSPFEKDAKIAKGILDPAAAAQMQASGGAAGGGSGGGGGGGGGGGASLGSDLNGANKDADKEAQIKTNKVSGNYSQGSGGGYKGVGKSKDDGNPFSSLFDAKGGGGGVEEDRSIASGDIDGAASGLFQKISKRYNQIQADKRIEAKNLE